MLALRGRQGREVVVDAGHGASLTGQDGVDDPGAHRIATTDGILPRPFMRAPARHVIVKTPFMPNATWLGTVQMYG